MSVELKVEMLCDEILREIRNSGQSEGYADSENECSVRISNPDSENGYNEGRGPLSWLNSARISTDPKDDAVHCVVSVGDPRGGFCFTVRRLRDGRIVIHMPYPKEGLPHMDTAELTGLGTLTLGNYDRDGKFTPGTYPDPEPAEGETDDTEDES